MSISGIDTVSMSDATLSTPKTSMLGKDDFLNLLITQLQNQDPLNPMKNTEFTAQLAQFSSLEELGNINENLEYLQQYQQALNNSQTVSFIGKNIEAEGNTIQLNDDGISDTIRFDLEEDASDVFINIYDSAGGFVKTVECGSLGAGEHSSKWDGTDNDGNELPDGVYTYEILAVDGNDEMVNTTTFTTGKVTAVTFKNDGAYLVIGNQEIPINSVIGVTEGVTKG